MVGQRNGHRYHARRHHHRDGWPGALPVLPTRVRGTQMVVPDADKAREQLVEKGVEASEVQELPWGRFVFFADPDGNTWSLQQIVYPSA